jgi:protocatechuate 3,4-dioxygenase beta subunit
MPMTRRQALTGLALSAAGTALAGPGDASAATRKPKIAATLPNNACILTAQAEEGPFYFDPRLVRADITEDRIGVPLHLTLQVLDVASCAPLAGARVDIWHADAQGLYSGYGKPGDPPPNAETSPHFLRGTQFTDPAGEVGFTTIYPGWYPGRTPHIHFKIFLDQTCVLIGQLYLPDALSEFIYGKIAPYDARKELRDTSNATDGVLKASGGGHGSFCTIKEDGGFYQAALVIAADRNGKPMANGPKGPPPGPGRMAGGPPPPDFEPPPGAPPGPPGGPPAGGPPPFGPIHARPADWDRSLVPGAPKPD